MAQCVPFLKVTDIANTIRWYENIGFTCIATNHIWEPEDSELNWAELNWDGATFMLGPDERNIINDKKDTSLWFTLDTVDSIIEILKSKGIPMHIEPETFYGMKVVSFVDINGFEVSFSCALVKK
jgi:uncharacterized glyoxalase superfamily protein PhnB